MKKAMFVLIPALLTISSNVFAEGLWHAGWAQGVEEVYTEPSPGNTIYLACQPQPITSADPKITIELKLGGKLPDDSVFVKFDGEKSFNLYMHDNWVDVESDVGMTTSDKFLKLLGEKKKVNIMFKNGDNLTFSLKGAKEAMDECYSYISTGH